jgi:hypothetical protein
MSEPEPEPEMCMKQYLQGMGFSEERATRTVTMITDMTGGDDDVWALLQVVPDSLLELPRINRAMLQEAISSLRRARDTGKTPQDVVREQDESSRRLVEEVERLEAWQAAGAAGRAAGAAGRAAGVAGRAARAAGRAARAAGRAARAAGRRVWPSRPGSTTRRVATEIDSARLEFSADEVYDHDWNHHGVPYSFPYTVRFWRLEGRFLGPRGDFSSWIPRADFSYVNKSMTVLRSQPQKRPPYDSRYVSIRTVT